jgi:hypothetical protein
MARATFSEFPQRVLRGPAGKLKSVHSEHMVRDGGLQVALPEGVVMAGGAHSGCPINAATEAFGDRWSLLILRDVMSGGGRHFGNYRPDPRKGSRRASSLTGVGGSSAKVRSAATARVLGRGRSTTPPTRRYNFQCSLSSRSGAHAIERQSSCHESWRNYARCTWSALANTTTDRRTPERRLKPSVRPSTTAGPASMTRGGRSGIRAVPRGVMAAASVLLTMPMSVEGRD